jgi:hypothetical protein
MILFRVAEFPQNLCGVLPKPRGRAHCPSGNHAHSAARVPIPRAEGRVVDMIKEAPGFKLRVVHHVESGSDRGGWDVSPLCFLHDLLFFELTRPLRQAVKDHIPIF